MSGLAFEGHEGEIRRFNSVAPHSGHLTSVASVPCDPTSSSKRCPHLRQSNSWIGITVMVVRRSDPDHRFRGRKMHLFGDLGGWPAPLPIIGQRP